MKTKSAQILEAIDNYCQTAYNDGHRSHLGASQIGEECKRKLWYVFRWCFQEQFSGRMYRLFNRGHLEENRFIEWLEGIGAKVWAEDYSALWYHPESESYFLNPNCDEGDGLAHPIESSNVLFENHVHQAKLQGVKFPQFRISDVLGHFGGSMDGICRLPPEFGIDEDILLEFKTNGTGAPFKKLCEEGLQVAKPQHWAQVCTYGKKRGLNYVLYMNICKNDDSIHVELAKLDHAHGEQMIIKAEQIITSQTPPARISNNCTYFGCKFCAAANICHHNAPVERNCRSCKFATPVENAEWFCNAHNGVIPKDFIPKSCEAWASINEVEN